MILVMKKGTDMREPDLEGLFAEALRQAPPESSALMGRVMADAVAHQLRHAAVSRRREMPRKSGYWSRIVLALGGKGVLAGLGTAILAGVMLGFTEPSALTTLTDGIFAQTPLAEVELLPSIDAILTEG